MVRVFPDKGCPNESLSVTAIWVWVSPSAGEVVAWAITVDAVADGDPAANVTEGVDVRVTVSVVSVAVNVTVSGTVSVKGNDTWPFAPVVAGVGAPTTALPVDDRLTAFPATGLFVDESRVTTTDVPCAPTGAGVETVTVDWEAETLSVPKVTEAVLAITVVSVVSVAVNVTVSAAVSVAVKVTTPEAFVTLGLAVGMMTALPVPARVTV